ncbi:MAG: HDOD domain-containing protein, partial [bacterium]|nr:HDOD domain-containing protein [bacterium]
AQVFEKLGGFNEGTGLDIEAFWRHSVGTGFVARAIAKKLQTEVDAAFLGGMLHDLGKIVLDRYFGDYYKSVTELVKEETISIRQAEQDILGVTHADVGGQLAEEWNFPTNYLNSILFHHNPRNTHRHQRLVCVVHLADVICRELEFGNGGDDVVPEIEESVLDRFTLGDRGLKILREAAAEDLADADSFLSGLAG